MPMPSAWSELVANVNGRSLFGSEGVRDPNNRCDAFAIGKPAGDCLTDGHYLCNECVERATCHGCGKRPMSCECTPCSWCRGDGFVGVVPCRECRSTGLEPPASKAVQGE